MPLIQVDWDNFEFRCHYFGELMTTTRGKSNLEKYEDAKYAHDKFADQLMSKSTDPTTAQLLKLNKLDEELKIAKERKDIPTLSNTCKKRLVQIYTEQTTGRIKDIESMYLEKGIQTEEDSITMYSQRTNTFYRKNKERKSNGFVNGEIDFDDEEKDTVIDTKGSWDVFTFDAHIAKPINPIYFWQLQMYMWLKNRRYSRLAYCLNETPKEIVDRLIKRMQYNFIGTPDDWEEAVAALKDKHSYKDLPLERKIRIYEVERDDEKIDMAKAYIPHFRNFLKNITNTKLPEDEYEDTE